MFRTKNLPVLGSARLAWLWAGFVGGAALLAGCSTPGPYVNSSVHNPVDLQASAAHQFDQVRVYEDDGELVVHGRVHHSHSHCSPAAHVDLSILDSSQQPVVVRSLPLIDRGQRRRGWAGAAFRTRIADHPQPGETIRLAFHDDGCRPSDHYDCRKNVAAAERTPSH